jgi:two-component system chemotaxis sensor kinase CheA
MCVLPLESILNVEMLARDRAFDVEGVRCIDYKEQAVPLCELALALGDEDEEDWGEAPAPVVMLTNGSNTIALRVDEILYEQEIVVKPLPPPLQTYPLIRGATIRPGGELVPVINVADLFLHTGLSRDASIRGRAKPARQPRALVVDDSLTSRLLLEDMIHGHGYEVVTAVNGYEALDILETSVFDAVVSDVEMPVVDGFELTRRIRSMEKLRDLPVILVTSLDSSESREQGLHAGASAYIVKGRLDQGKLLTALDSLVLAPA